MAVVMSGCRSFTTETMGGRRNKFEYAGISGEPEMKLRL